MKMKKRTYSGTVSDAVTERETQHRAITRRAAAEGFVLLKNEDHVLPVDISRPIGLYGAGAVCTAKGGTGSGDVNERDSVTIYQGMKNAGFTITSEEWIQAYTEANQRVFQSWCERVVKEAKASGDPRRAMGWGLLPPIDQAGEMPLAPGQAENDGADTAVYVLRRNAGEGLDRQEEKGDYYLSDSEQTLLSQVCAGYKNVILVINSGGLVDLSFADTYSSIKAILYFVQAGQEGGSAFADILRGAVAPSGKLTDTWANAYSDYPSAQTFGSRSGDPLTIKYREGIYVGYRYFDTFRIPVKYGFGYGLSYTSFDIRTEDVAVTGRKTQKAGITVTVEVKNAGTSYSGKEVVQIYVSCPQNGRSKEFRKLCAFGKTKTLAPGESQTLKLFFSAEQLGWYDEGRACWMLDGGLYGIWAGSSLTGSRLVGSVEIDADTILTQCRNICPVREALAEMRPDEEDLRKREAEWNKAAEALPKIFLSSSDIVTTTVAYTKDLEVISGEAGKIVNTLSQEQLIELATGVPPEIMLSDIGNSGKAVPGSAAETPATAAEDPWNLASIVLADGPAGLRLTKTYWVNGEKVYTPSKLAELAESFDDAERKGTAYYQFCTAVPVGTLLAQTWNPELVARIGVLVAREMEELGVTLWLAPGMNIHRNPLCGRNFEYYSEDPLVSGIMAAAMTRGVQSVPGCGTTIKHFACNNQEERRRDSDSIVNERALREIYLRGFEIVVKTSRPMSIMTSYNMVNGVHAANSCDLCTAVARDEWGFDGAIMTDWATVGPRTLVGECTAAGCIRAGNDMIMPGSKDDWADLEKELANGTLTLERLRWCVWHTAKIILASNRYENAKSYLDGFDGAGSFMEVR